MRVERESGKKIKEVGDYGVLGNISYIYLLVRFDHKSCYAPMYVACPLFYFFEGERVPCYATMYDHKICYAIMYLIYFLKKKKKYLIFKFEHIKFFGKGRQ